MGTDLFYQLVEVAGIEKEFQSIVFNILYYSMI